MASFNDPKVSNSILSDVNALRALIRSLATMNPASGNSDMPEGSIQFIPTSEGMQFRQYNGSAWSAITSKLMHDVDKVDGYDASKTSIAENIIPVYKTGGLIAGGCEGNAGTASKLKNAVNIDIGGYISGTAVQFDGSKNITLNVNRIDVNNESDNVLNGIISKAHSGTGRDDGAASDIVLPNGGKASDYGQIGDAKNITGTDLNTLIVSGNYISNGGTVALHYPKNSSDIFRINVSSQGTYVKQIVYSGSEVWVRDSKDTGASWGALQCIGASNPTSLIIYISKSGSDNNTGLDMANPVLTINRALAVAKNLAPTNAGTVIEFRIGEGDWGSVVFTALPYILCISSYSGDIATEYSDSLPHFTTITSYGSNIRIGSVVSGTVESNNDGFIYITTHYIRLSTLLSRKNGVILLEGDSTSYPVEIVSSDNQASVYYTYTYGNIIHAGNRKIIIVETLNVSDAFLVEYSGSFITLSTSEIVLNDGITVTGKKYNIEAGSRINYSSIDSLPGTLSGTKGIGSIINGIPYGGGASDEALMADMSWKKVLLQTGGEITGKLAITGDDDLLKLKDNRYSVDDTSIDSDIYSNLYFLDKNNQFAGVVQCAKGVTGNSSISLITRAKSTNNNAAISLQQDSNGNSIAYCPTPPDSAKNTEIVTAAWANKNIGSKLEGYLPLTGGDVSGRLNARYSDLSLGSFNSKHTDFRSDGEDFYILINPANSDNWNDLRPFRINLSTGAVYFNHGCYLYGTPIVRSVNGATADANGNVNVTSVPNTGYWPAYQLAMNGDRFNFNFYIRTPAWGTTWFVVGYAAVRAASYNWSNTFFGFAGANTDIVNITANGGVRDPNPHWTAQNVCCFRIA